MDLKENSKVLRADINLVDLNLNKVRVVEYPDSRNKSNKLEVARLKKEELVNQELDQKYKKDKKYEAPHQELAEDLKEAHSEAQ